MAMRDELIEAIADYDRNTARTRIGAMVKALRQRGVNVTEIRESLDALGIPARMQLLAGERVIWEHVRLDVVLDDAAPKRSAAPEPLDAHHELPGPSPLYLPREDDDGPHRRGLL